MSRVAVFPGTYDPITRGHEDLIARGLSFADHVIVAVAVEGGKELLFSAEERVALAKLAVGDDPGIEVLSFDGLLVDFVRRVGGTILVRGLRYVSDFE